MDFYMHLSVSLVTLTVPPPLYDIILRGPVKYHKIIEVKPHKHPIIPCFKLKLDWCAVSTAVYPSKNFYPTKQPPFSKLTHFSGKRPYICSTCQNSFNCSSSLSVHQWKHRNYRPYYCPHCKKGFVKRVTMIQHKTRCFEMKKSSSRKEETTFDCQTCNGKFSSNQLLEEHVCKNEKGELVFKCHVCKEMIVGRPEFIEHVRQRHFVEVAGNQWLLFSI